MLRGADAAVLHALAALGLPATVVRVWEDVSAMGAGGWQLTRAASWGQWWLRRAVGYWLGCSCGCAATRRPRCRTALRCLPACTPQESGEMHEAAYDEWDEAAVESAMVVGPVQPQKLTRRVGERRPSRVEAESGGEVLERDAKARLDLRCADRQWSLPPCRGGGTAAAADLPLPCSARPQRACPFPPPLRPLTQHHLAGRAGRLAGVDFGHDGRVFRQRWVPRHCRPACLRQRRPTGCTRPRHSSAAALWDSALPRCTQPAALPATSPPRTHRGHVQPGVLLQPGHRGGGAALCRAPRRRTPRRRLARRLNRMSWLAACLLLTPGVHNCSAPAAPGCNCTAPGTKRGQGQAAPAAHAVERRNRTAALCLHRLPGLPQAAALSMVLAT